jgi:hypothetical protein
MMPRYCLALLMSGLLVFTLTASNSVGMKHGESIDLTDCRCTRCNWTACSGSRACIPFMERDRRGRWTQRAGLRAYLARAGKRVLVLETRTRVGGACTIEESFPGVRMSPCAYLAGLLHPLVISELNLLKRGFRWTPAVNGLFVPFLDGSSIQLWDDDEACAAEVRRFAPGDVDGWRAMNDVIRRLRDMLRPPEAPVVASTAQETLSESLPAESSTPGAQASAPAASHESSPAEAVTDHPTPDSAPAKSDSAPQSS